jgi:hypothetical protein
VVWKTHRFTRTLPTYVFSPGSLTLPPPETRDFVELIMLCNYRSVIR